MWYSILLILDNDGTHTTACIPAVTTVTNDLDVTPHVSETGAIATSSTTRDLQPVSHDTERTDNSSPPGAVAGAAAEEQTKDEELRSLMERL